MPRPSRWIASLLLLIALSIANCPAALAGDESVEEKWYYDRAMVLSPAAEPIPALKYSFLPLISERKEGNAVPIYLRLVYERNDATLRLWSEKPEVWLKLPSEKMPLAEVKDFLRGASTVYQQLEFGARRTTADWNYTLDLPDGVMNVLLPDAQKMRMFSRMLALEARFEVLEKDYVAAAHTLETLFAFSRHLAEAPFLINDLVGIAAANVAGEAVVDLIEQPDAPNMYWALTTLPHPLIEIRKGLEMERRLLDLHFGELINFRRPRSPAEWDETLARLRRKITSDVYGGRNAPDAVPDTEPEDAASKSPDLMAARKYLVDRRQFKLAEVMKLPAAQVLLLYLVGRYRELADDKFRLSYLPYSEARLRLADADARLKQEANSEPVRLARAMLPSISNIQRNQTSLERKLAALCVVEALRMHAAAHGGALPDKLEEITLVPVPPDPMTGAAFAYTRNGDGATLVSQIVGDDLAVSGLRIKITMRK